MNKFSFSPFCSVIPLLLANVIVAQEQISISDALAELYERNSYSADAGSNTDAFSKVIASQTADRSTLIYRCRYVTAKSIVNSVESATSSTGTVEVSEEQNIITVNDINQQMDELKDLITTLDSRGPQVLVEAQIIEVQMGDSQQWDSGLNVTHYDESRGVTSSIGSVAGERLGFTDFNSAPSNDATQNPNYPNSSGGWIDIFPTLATLSNGDLINLNARLKWLQGNNRAEILSSPNLLVDLGATATVSTGTDLPLLKSESKNTGTIFSTYYKRTGVNLRVTPELINDSSVTLQVRPEVTSVVRTEVLNSTTSSPVISVRNLDTKLNVQDGGVIMMGGLFSSRNIESEERVPVLSHIPLLGAMFRSAQEEEVKIQLIFLLKVTIIPDSTKTLLNNIDSTEIELKGVGAVLGSSLSTKQVDEGDE